jgi:rhodanese-related sulfurtransferase
MYGFWVSEDTAEALRNKGIKARILEGGISAWRAMGQPTDHLDGAAQ